MMTNQLTNCHFLIVLITLIQAVVEHPHSAPRHMQMTNKSTVHMKPKKKPGKKLFPVKKNLNKLFLLLKLELLKKNESVLLANDKSYD